MENVTTLWPDATDAARADFANGIPDVHVGWLAYVAKRGIKSNHNDYGRYLSGWISAKQERERAERFAAAEVVRTKMAQEQSDKEWASLCRHLKALLLHIERSGIVVDGGDYDPPFHCPSCDVTSHAFFDAMNRSKDDVNEAEVSKK